MSANKEYKIVLSSDGNFAGKSDRLTWEHVLNSLAEQGWRVVSFTSASFTRGGSTGELTALLERDKK